ncbi:uncharacterized protein LOC132286767 isoform X2 [Cornus florida]|uniref:uncharacterized protein LOC132286767 isoform X2 n=1 Tax=Cornus florida TaxID=4283 RepID=UPI00289C4975|nr:uncharacterized protein LOC132286767 isoform X2 [Cornus florida]
MQQHQPRQQTGFNDMQMLQQHIIFKKLQELQRQPQLQELGDARLQNYINQLSAINKQNSGGQFQPLINGTPVHDASQMFMVGNVNSVLHDVPPSVPEFPNGLVGSQARSQPLGSMGLLPQQLDVSLYGSPIPSARYNLSQYSHLQGISNDSADVLTKYSDNLAKPAVRSSAFSNPFAGDHHNVPSDQLCMPDGAFISEQVCQQKNLLGLPENFPQVNSLQRNASQQEFSGRQEHAGWPGLFPVKTTQNAPSQHLATLDPLEEKILFNMDDTSWDNSFGRCTGMNTGNFENTSECTDYLGSLPSIQSGSWSALMQSAVAEVSSSDTGLQEEWSGLSFQNTEMSTDNQPSSFMDSGVQQTGWVDNNAQSVSSLSSESLFNDSNMSSILPGFQQSTIHFPIKQREVMCSHSPHESFEQSVNDASDCNYQQAQPIEGGQPDQILQPLENAWPGQNKHSKNDTHQRSISSYTSSNLSCNKLIGENVASSSPYGNGMLNICNKDNASRHIITGHELTENAWQYRGDSRPVAGGNQTLSGQVSLASSGHKQGYFGQFKSAGNVSNGIMDLEKGHPPDVQRNSKASDEVPPIGNARANLSAPFHRSVGFYGSNTTVQTSQNKLKLLHKDDHEREHSTVTHFGSTDSNPLSELPKEETPDTSVAQQYSHHSASQRFGLRLAHPSQQLPNSNICFSSQTSTRLVTATSPSGPYLGNQLQRQNLSAAQPTLPTMASKLPHYNFTTSQDTSHPICTNPFGQQFTIPEAESITQPFVMSVASQQVGFSSRPPSKWTNASTQQHLAGPEPGRVSSSLFLSTGSTNNSLETTTWAPNELHDQNFSRVRTASVEFDACCMNSQGTECGEEQHRKERSHQQISSERFDLSSRMGGLSQGQESMVKHASEANSMASFSFMDHSNQQHIDRAAGDGQSPAFSARDLEAFGRSLKPSHFLHKNYSLLHQVQSVKNVETDNSNRVSLKFNEASPDMNLQDVTAVAENQLMYGHNLGINNPLNDVPNAALQLNLYPTRDMNFSSEVKKHQSVKDSSHHLQDTPQEMVTLVQSYPESHSSSSNVVSNRTEFPQITLQMAPSWFQHYGTLESRQILPMYDARAAKNAAQQFPLGKPFGNLHMNTSVVSVNAADGSQIGTVWPTTDKRASPYVLPLGVPDQNLTIVRPKKRKIATSELLPWHKEVTQGPQRLENISKAELEWAQAANQLTEKVEDEAKMTEAVQPMLRSKKRLILTTQLMQQMFRPIPATILSAEAALNYDTVAYFTARLALGDACCLVSCSRSDSHLSSNHTVIISQKLWETILTEQRSWKPYY